MIRVKDLFLNVNKKYIALLILFLIATNVVYVRMYFTTPPSHHYTGIGLEATADKAVYYAMIQQGMHGSIFMHNPHTSEPQADTLFSPQWFAVGMTATVLHMPFQLAYHIWRAIFALFLFYVLYLFVRKLFADEWTRWCALATALFASGLGWFYYQLYPDIGNRTVHWIQNFNHVPADLYVTEMNTYLTTLQSPLFILSYVLIVSIVYLIVQLARTWKASLGVWLFLATVFLVAVHPYDAVTIVAVTGSFAVWELWRTRSWHPVNATLIVFGAVILSSMYILWTFMSEPALAGWMQQNVTPSPALAPYLWSLGIFTPLWITGLYFLIRNKEISPWWIIMICWSVWIMIAIYLPVNVNRRFTATWFIPISFIAFYGVQQVILCIKQYYFKMALVCMLCILGFSGTIYSLVQQAFWQPRLDEKYAYYLDRYAWNALQFANKQMSAEDILLSNEVFISMLFGAYSDVRLYVGHGHQTKDFWLKKQQVDWFFSSPKTSTALQRKKDFIHEQRINYIVLYTPSMKTDYQWLIASDFTEQVYYSPGFIILKAR